MIFIHCCTFQSRPTLWSLFFDVAVVPTALPPPILGGRISDWMAKSSRCRLPLLWTMARAWMWWRRTPHSARASSSCFPQTSRSPCLSHATACVCVCVCVHNCCSWFCNALSTNTHNALVRKHTFTATRRSVRSTSPSSSTVLGAKQSRCASTTAPLRWRLACSGLRPSRLLSRSTRLCSPNARCDRQAIHTHTHTHTHTRHVNTYTYACTCTHTHMHMHMHIHTRMLLFSCSPPPLFRPSTLAASCRARTRRPSSAHTTQQSLHLRAFRRS